MTDTAAGQKNNRELEEIEESNYDLDITEHLEPMQRITKDIKDASRILTPREARYLVDTYYAMQRQRIRTTNQQAAMTRLGEPHSVISWFASQNTSLEHQVARALAAFAAASPVCQWAMTIRGIGPIVSAGLAAHIDITKAPTVGHIWRFAGLDPTVKWQKAEKVRATLSSLNYVQTADPNEPVDEDVIALACAEYGRSQDTIIAYMEGSMTLDALSKAIARSPFNQGLKTLCWKIGESFLKVKNHEEDVYGHIMDQRYELEKANNEIGMYAGQAVAMLKRSPGHKQKKIYKEGKLPPGHLLQRSKRYAVKFFLAHWHHVRWEIEFGEAPPKPWIFTQPEHTHYLGPPNWPMK